MPGEASQAAEVRVVMSAPTPRPSPAEAVHPFAGAAKGATQRVLAANTPSTATTPGMLLCSCCRALVLLLVR